MKKTFVFVVIMVILTGGFDMFGRDKFMKHVEYASMDVTALEEDSTALESIKNSDEGRFTHIGFGEDNDPEIVEIGFGEDNDPEIVEVFLLNRSARI